MPVWSLAPVRRGGVFGGAIVAPLLLDSLSTTPAVAYSTRKLRSAYAGSALRVRRSSDDAEQDIGFDGSGNLDTSALTAFVGANDGIVVVLYDQSVNANDATQPTVGQAPIIVTSGSVETLNSKATVRYRNTVIAGMGFTVSLSQPTTIALPFIQTSVVADAHLTDGVNGFPRQLLTADGVVYRMYANGSVQTGGTVDTSQHGFIGVFNGASSVGYIDNVSTITGDPGNDGMGFQFIGCSGAGTAPISFPGKIPEYIVFASSLGSPDRALLKSSWATYWGTP